ncbi:MAG TPA: hypothetical protein VJ901_02470 [Thermoanaerobaculia bacterium]|nr:hypothetical protein [Thermoanaerobaculia bacterium]
MADLFTIKPGVGVGDLRFGATRDEVRTIAGPPSETLPSEEDAGSELWIYEDSAIALGFVAEENMRLVSCETYSMKASFKGETLVGFDRESAEAALERAGADEGVFIAEDEEEGGGQIAVPRLALSLWFGEHAVESVGWGVFVDDEDTVLWPTT